MFALRIDDTNKLLDIYIDLLRQSEKTQTLLTDPEWKGATEVSYFSFLPERGIITMHPLTLLSLASSWQDTTAHARALEQAAAETARLQAQAAETAREADKLRAATIQRATTGSGTVGSGARGARGARGAAARGGSLAGRSASGTAPRQSSVTRGASTAGEF